MHNLKNVDKAFKIQPLVFNSSNRNIKSFLLDYFLFLKSNEPIIDDFKSLDTCINYLCSISFDFTIFGITEIPLEDLYCFESKTGQYFDLFVSADNTVSILYVDDNSNQQEAESIEEAIKNYVNYEGGL